MVEHSKHTVNTSHRKSSATNSANSGKFSSAAYLADLLVELDRAAIARRIADAREQAGLTQPEMGDALRGGVHYRTVQVWERGQRNKKGEHQWVIPWDRLGEIADITGVTKEWLLHGEEQRAVDPSVNERLARIEQVLEVIVARLDRDEPSDQDSAAEE